MKIETYILEQLAYLSPYIYHKATSTNSIYIKFLDERIGSIRIGDHNGIGKYRYRWNLRRDLKEEKIEYDRGVVRHYYPFEQKDLMIEAIKKYHKINILGKINETRKSNHLSLGVFT